MSETYPTLMSNLIRNKATKGGGFASTKAAASPCAELPEYSDGMIPASHSVSEYLGLLSAYSYMMFDVLQC